MYNCIKGGDSYMNNPSNNKMIRVLDIYNRLISGEVVRKSEEARYYNVNERSIQRDIDDIRCYLDGLVEKIGIINSVIYDRNLRGYRLEQVSKMTLSNSEILAICKILLDSRSFTKKEMSSMLERLIDCCVPKENQKLVEKLIRNEEFHYIEPNHKTVFIDKLWSIGQAIYNNQVIEISYQRIKDKTIVNRRVQPLAIMFSEYYFYMAAFIDDEELKEHFDVINDSNPTIYRVDRIKQLNVCDERFHIPYSSRFEEGEFRKRVQFMYGGKLRKVKFKYVGPSIEAVIDRLPTAKILDEDESGWIIEAEVYGEGIEMWLRSQGKNIKEVKK